MMFGLPMHAWRHVCIAGDTVRGGSTFRARCSSGDACLLWNQVGQWRLDRLAAVPATGSSTNCICWLQ